MAHEVTLTAERRSAKGKGAARKLRAAGRLPAVTYGHGREPEALSLSQTELEQALIAIAAASTLIDLTVDGRPVKTLIREIQRTDVRRDIMHVDFYEIHADEKITLKVPVHLVGTPDGVRHADGVLDQVLREIEIEALGGGGGEGGAGAAEPERIRKPRAEEEAEAEGSEEAKE